MGALLSGVDAPAGAGAGTVAGAGARPQATSAEVGAAPGPAGTAGLAGAFGFGSELALPMLPAAELPAPALPAAAFTWQSIPVVLWMACLRFSEWSARPKAPASPGVAKASVRT